MTKNQSCCNFETSDDDRTKALVRTKDTLIELDKIRRGLELPPESLLVVRAVHEDSLRSVTSERIQVELALEQNDSEHDVEAWGLPPITPMSQFRGTIGRGLRVSPSSSGLRAPERMSLPLRAYDEKGEQRFVKQGQTLVIVVMPPTVAYRPSELRIPRHAHEWVIESIVIGNREQLAGHLPGTAFVNGAYAIQCETAQTAMDIRVCVRFVGDVPNGAPFPGRLVGDAVLRSEPFAEDGM